MFNNFVKTINKNLLPNYTVAVYAHYSPDEFRQPKCCGSLQSLPSNINFQNYRAIYTISPVPPSTTQLNANGGSPPTYDQAVANNFGRVIS